MVNHGMRTSLTISKLTIATPTKWPVRSSAGPWTLARPG